MSGAGRSNFAGGSSSTPRQRPGGRDSLPVRRHGSRIVEKILLNRVTLIFADAGSGKSSQVPQLLLEQGTTPVLCTQPRRLAVVAVAKRVAEERHCELGDEVGYQIGQLNASTNRTKIVFKTAGVLFEELKSSGAEALARYKVVILDEVHERSVESDLVLTCIRQLLRSTNVKLVLMSATADLLKYEEYFKEIHRDEGVEKIAIPNIENQLQNVILNTKVHYLEQTVKLLGNVPAHKELLDALTKAFAPAEKAVDIGDGIQDLIRDLIVHLHSKHEDKSQTVLVFLPTYRALEQQWLLLRHYREFQVYVLHSSIEVDTCIRAMEACPRNRRKIILATNVAESSVTISGVSFVVDACRSLEVYWDNKRKKDKPRVVWISESQANQRKGRTGRTCDGVVYRLVPRNLFLRLEKYETPAMQLLSLRKQVLMILCSESRFLNDPAGLLRRCINPPAPETVQDALLTLEEMKTITVDGRGRTHATAYGKLLVALPLSLEASVLVVRRGQLGYPREGAILGAIMDSSPKPIVQPFGNQDMYARNLHNYYNPNDGNEDEQAKDVVRRSFIAIANLYAFEFWELNFKNKQRGKILKQIAKNFAPHEAFRDMDSDISESSWCERHNLSITALHAVAETVDTVMEALHRHRPKFLSKVSGSPAYYNKGFPEHSCQDKEEGAPTEVSDPSIDVFSQRSDLMEDNEGDVDNCWTASLPLQLDSVSDPWKDWSFQESEKKMNNFSNPHEETIFCDRPNGVGAPKPTTCNGILDGIKALSLQDANGHAERDRNHHVIDIGNSNSRSNGCEQGSVTPPDFACGVGALTCPRAPYTLCGTFHTQDDEKVLTALYDEVQRGSFNAAGAAMDEGQDLGNSTSTPIPVCGYFLRGACLKGESCSYLHSLSYAPTPCRYFNSPGGCRYGPACIYVHNGEERLLLSAAESPLKFDETTPTAQSMLDLLPTLKMHELLLLFGEGDFSFAESLSTFIDPKQIFATSFDGREDAVAEKSIKTRIRKLDSLRMPILWNVDATSLYPSADDNDNEAAIRTLTQSIPWYNVRCVLWNFPFIGLDGSTLLHKSLMVKFFVTMSIVMISKRLTSVPVIITLCRDQFCRWQVDRAARDAFFFLRTSAPFGKDAFGGYSPMRNDLGSIFPVQRPFTYVFDLHAPSGFEVQY